MGIRGQHLMCGALCLLACGGCTEGRVLKGSLAADAFSIVAVDDSSDPFAGIEGPLPGGVEIRTEPVPLGRELRGARKYAYIRKGEEDTLSPALAHIKDWIAVVKLPTERRLGWGPVFARDAAGGAPHLSGWRSFVLVDKAVVDGTQIDQVEAQTASAYEPAHLLIKFNSTGAKALERFTVGHVKRRAAIVVHGSVESAPVIQEAIAGGVIRLNTPTGDTGLMLKRLRRSQQR